MPACWSCAHEAAEELFCPACGVLQPARPRDPFAVLGLPVRFSLSTDEVDRAWKERSRKLHPDRFVRASPRERRLAVEHTDLVNRARKSLRDPGGRAEAIVRMNGLAVPADTSGVAGAGSVLPLSFYEQVMDDREALAEARAAGPEAVSRILGMVESRSRDTLAAIESALLRWESTGEADALRPVPVELAKMRYHARLADEAAGRPHD